MSTVTEERARLFDEMRFQHAVDWIEMEYALLFGNREAARKYIKSKNREELERMVYGK